jgi:ubiquinone/menaquinone biosynthesis C-methylase UbiE
VAYAVGRGGRESPDSSLINALRRVAIPRHAGLEGIDNDEVVEAYNRISRWPQFRLLRKIVIAELKRHKPEGLIVDVGCGPGYLIANLARSFPDLSIIGVDMAKEMLLKARNNLTSSGLNREASFRLGNIQDMPFESGSIDFVISTLSLHHWSEPTQAIEEIYRVLKPGGQFLVFDLRRDALHLVYWLMRFAQSFILPKALKQIDEPTGSFLAAYTLNEARHLIATASFKLWETKPGPFWLFIWGKKQPALVPAG